MSLSRSKTMKSVLKKVEGKANYFLLMSYKQLLLTTPTIQLEIFMAFFSRVLLISLFARESSAVVSLKA